MENLKRVIGAVHFLAAIAVAVQQMFSATWSDAWENSHIVWDILNPVMFVAIMLALIFNYVRKSDNDACEGGSMTREYFESNVMFYLTSALAILFVYSWVGELTRGGDEGGGTLAGVAWTFVNVTFILISAATGAHLLRSATK